MKSTGWMAALAAAVCVLCSTATPAATQLAGTAPVMPAATRAASVTVQGDSLSVMSRGYLAAQLDRARVVSYSAQVGRHVQEGMTLLRRQPLGRVIVFALGTNDYAADAGWYRRQLHQVLKLAGPRRCVVVPTVYAYGAVSGFNSVIRALARKFPGRVEMAHWAGAVQRGRVQLGDDVHPSTQAGARFRARQISRAVSRCLA